MRSVRRKRYGLAAARGAAVFALWALAAAPAPGGVLAGVEAYRNGDFETAFREFKRDAEAGDMRAQYNLGVMLLKGTGVKRDVKAALKWHRKSAEQGYAAAQHGLGVIYYQGDGVAVDHKKAAKWFRKAAEQDFVQSQLNLGVMYLTGHGVAKDGAEVVKWITLAAAKGLAEAQYRLGVMYDKGMIFRPNKDEATRWYEKASKQGHQKSVERLAALAAARLADIAPAAGAKASPPPPKAAPKPAGAMGAAWRVQLASFRTAADAESHWNRLKERIPDLVADLAPETVAADLGQGRGVYHRLVVGPLASRAAANALCRDIRERVPRQGCLPYGR